MEHISLNDIKYLTYIVLSKWKRENNNPRSPSTKIERPNHAHTSQVHLLKIGIKPSPSYIFLQKGIEDGQWTNFTLAVAEVLFIFSFFLLPLCTKSQPTKKDIHTN